jgi:hypothetical protein
MKWFRKSHFKLKIPGSNSYVLSYHKSICRKDEILLAQFDDSGFRKQLLLISMHYNNGRWKKLKKKFQK